MLRGRGPCRGQTHASVPNRCRHFLERSTHLLVQQKADHSGNKFFWKRVRCLEDSDRNATRPAVQAPHDGRTHRWPIICLLRQQLGGYEHFRAGIYAQEKEQSHRVSCRLLGSRRGWNTSDSYLQRDQTKVAGILTKPLPGGAKRDSLVCRVLHDIVTEVVPLIASIQKVLSSTMRFPLVPPVPQYPHMLSIKQPFVAFWPA
jgi:hypothetical protein